MNDTLDTNFFESPFNAEYEVLVNSPINFIQTETENNDSILWGHTTIKRIISIPENDKTESSPNPIDLLPCIQNNNYKTKPVWIENYFQEIERINSPRGPKFLCQECQDMLNTKLSFLTHSKMHCKPLCFVCFLYFETEENLENHMMENHRSLVTVTLVSDNKTNFEKANIEGIINDNNNNETDITGTQLINQLFCDNTEIVLNKRKKIICKPIAAIKRVRKGKRKSIIAASRPRSVTKTVTSRFGRCRSVKVPEF